MVIRELVLGLNFGNGKCTIYIPLCSASTQYCIPGRLAQWVGYVHDWGRHTYCIVSSHSDVCVYKIHPVVCGGMYSKSIVLLYKMLYIIIIHVRN